tara:strand:- start:877 stop:1542 length:666 start_codon:yes stop_codon:yes gene_type:complete
MSSYNKSDLHLNWANYAAVLYACKKWHYSKSVPTGKLIKVGVWEKGVFIGCLVYSRGANYRMLNKYGLRQDQGCELTRIALSSHITTVSRILSISLKFLKKSSPSLQLVVSYADPMQDHHGGVYQASNWIYSGLSSPAPQWWFKGKWAHNKTVYESKLSKSEKSRLKRRVVPGKHTYLMPLTSQMREKALSLSKPYPMRLKQVQVSTPDTNGGAAPTQTLL